MKIIPKLVWTAFAFVLFSCTKDAGESAFMRAKIDGSGWLATSGVSVIVANGIPVAVKGSQGTETIYLKITQPITGNYPFRQGDINPTTLLSFDVTNFESSHKVRWSTGTETNLNLFTVESSQDGVNWLQVAMKVPTGSVSSYEAIVDNSYPILNSVYYRLKIFDNNGSFAYSNIRVISGLPAYYQSTADPARCGYDGNLEITSMDQSNKTITGRFYFKAKTQAGVVYNITEGEFRANY